MGVMRFLIYPPSVADDCPEIFRAYLSGWDGRVFPTRVEVDGTLMACRRPASESGKLHVAWPVEGFGRPVICTSSLPEREQPYVLAVELARGRISQVRDQLSAWELQGLSIPAEFRKVHQAAHHLFAQAVAAQQHLETATELAQQAIRTESRAADMLAEAYTQQRLTYLWNRSRQSPALLGCRLGRSVPNAIETELCGDVFSAAGVPIEWKHIEPAEGRYDWEANDAQVDWCEDQKLLTFGGPLLDLSPNGLPEWLWQWEHDVVSMQSFVCDFVETAIRRYFGRIRSWEIAVRANSGGAMTLSEEDRLSLTARTLEVARQVDEEIQLLIGVDQPWGDYQARGHHRLSPFQFVDAIVRSGVGLSALNLEFAIGYQPRGTAPRDRLMVSQLIDRWSTLGIPLYVTLAVPSRPDSEPQGNGDLEVPAHSPWREPWSDDAQARWIEEFVPLLMAKQAVVGVFWAQLADGPDQRYPSAGLIDDTGRAKTAYRSVKSIEQFDGKSRTR